VTKIIGFQKKGKKFARKKKKLTAIISNSYFLNISLSFEEKIS